MRRLFAAALALAALPLFARNLTISTDEHDPVTQCSQIRVRFDGDYVPFIEEDVAAVRGLRSLNVRAPRNGGIFVYGTDDATFSVKSCKAAWRSAVAASIASEVHGNELTANVPDSDGAVVYFIVRAPRYADLEVHTHNGPLSIEGLRGTVTADAHNGPISFSGDSGTVKIDAHNGPISINLDGAAFNGTLDVHAHNGPLSLKVPHDYRSGVIVDSTGRGPVSCHADVCREARRTWDDDSRHIELGSGAQVVRLSVGNGPLSINE